MIKGAARSAPIFLLYKKLIALIFITILVHIFPKNDF
jgi:hypothetical protein